MSKDADQSDDTAREPQRSAHRDLRLELKVKNNVLHKEIFSRYGSVAGFCHAQPKFRNRQGFIGDLLRFKVSPFRKKHGAGGWVQTNEYREACIEIAAALGILVEDLFPEHLYARLVGTRTEKAIEVSSFSALPAVRREVLALPAPAEVSPEAIYEETELRERVTKSLETLPPHMRQVIEYHHGMVDGREWSFREIAELMNLPRTRVGRLYHEAIALIQSSTRRYRHRRS